MKVAELIALLREQPADMEVLVQSYEEGFDPVTHLKPIAVTKGPDKRWYVGVYEETPKSGQTMLSIQSRYNRMDREDIRDDA